MGVYEYDIMEKEIPLIGLNSSMTYTLGTIKFPVMAKRTIMMENFVVVDSPLHYKLIVGRLWMHKTRVVPSNYHQVIKSPLWMVLLRFKVTKNRHIVVITFP